ncbi:hypothetical protein JOB18_007729 [Solea senegalensis]|uniref:Uncharacterized protein n=1 Tax=Solea senegalensis TaxID=28829 RepID=A0AAV6PSQ1_SOLSE|nr:hypothetical protein JOB18_007729 [Solea senegalensis]
MAEKKKKVAEKLAIRHLSSSFHFQSITVDTVDSTFEKRRGDSRRRLTVGYIQYEAELWMHLTQTNRRRRDYKTT